MFGHLRLLNGSFAKGCSVEVMRADRQRLIRKGSKARGLHMDHAILILQWTFDEEESAAGHDQALPLIEIGRRR